MGAWVQGRRRRCGLQASGPASAVKQQVKSAESLSRSVERRVRAAVHVLTLIMTARRRISHLDLTDVDALTVTHNYSEPNSKNENHVLLVYDHFSLLIFYKVCWVINSCIFVESELLLWVLQICGRYHCSDT